MTSIDQITTLSKLPFLLAKKMLHQKGCEKEQISVLFLSHTVTSTCTTCTQKVRQTF